MLATLALIGHGSALAGTGFRLMLPAWPQKPGGAFGPGMTTAVGVGANPLSAPTTPATGNRTGLVLTLDTTWVDGNGYRPVRITVTPTVPTTADRSLRVSYRPGNYRGATVAVTGDIELPAGFTSVTKTLSVPQIGAWQSVAFDVFEDGEYLRELSIPQNYMGMGIGQYSGDSASPSILVLNSTANASLVLNAIGRSGQPVLQVGPSNTVSTSSMYIPGNPPRQLMTSQMGMIPTIAELPTHWIDYSSIDIILASRQDLQTLVEKHEAQWGAIRRWILAGGNLWVYGVGSPKQQNWAKWDLAQDKPWEQLQAVSDWIDFPPPLDASQSENVPRELHGWLAPDPTKVTANPNLYPQYNQYTTSTQIITDSAAAAQVPFLTQPTLKDGRSPFVMRRLGHGMVVAIPDNDPTNNGYFRWEAVFNNVGAESWHWSTRNALNFTAQNDNYWNFLIPGVGAAPVTAFQVLITLFVLAIGPVNFYVLKRWHKLNLLLITVPASAAVITVALLLYAVFSDGFGVRARTRSFTELNQETGDATCVGRMTFYAGLTPSKGLSFSGDVTVYPLTEEPSQNQFDSGLTRRLAWVSESAEDRVGQQQLESGWLQSRIQTQLVTVRSGKSEARLDIAVENGRAASVTNKLGTQILALLVRDAAGNYSTAGDLSESEKAELAALADGESPAELARWNREKALFPPDGVELGGSHSIFGIRRRYYGRRFTNIGVSSVDVMQAGMLERAINDSLHAAAYRELPPQSYVAVVERSPEFELGLDSAAEESSLHVIYGRW